LLKRISCDKFLSNGSIREPIVFHSGLNTVLGSPDAKNSIGKSTFLMIIDFVFGGTDYLSKDTKDTVDNIGHHTIKFDFEFDRESLYFSRSTDNPSFINMCDSNFNVVKIIPLNEYNKALANRYGFRDNGISLRDFVGRFFRIYHRETTNEKFPLRSATQENVNAGIVALIKMFNKYHQISEQEHIKNETQEKESAFKKAKSFNQIKAAPNNTAFKENHKDIEKLETELYQLTIETQRGLSDLDSFQAQELAEIKKQLSSLRRQRTQLNSQLGSYEYDSKYTNKNFKHSYDSLKEYFPNANYEELDKVEAFHLKLANILKKEFKQSEDEINLLLSIVKEKISSLESKANHLKTAPTISKAILLKYADITKKIEVLKEANKNFSEHAKLKDNLKSEKDKYDELLKSTMISIENTLNSLMKDYTDRLYNGEKTAPTIEIADSSHYHFFTPNDTGTGSLCRGLVIFDLVMLNNTKLPAVVHDTIILKHIEDETLEKLIELYSTSSKQIFIAFDRDTTYSKKMQSILNDSKVLKLSPGGNELFGRAWNDVKKED
jgi:ABC-type phosphate transport system auxiliary subunit